MALVTIWKRYCKDYKEVEPNAELFPCTENLLNAILYDLTLGLDALRDEVAAIPPR